MANAPDVCICMPGGMCDMFGGDRYCHDTGCMEGDGCMMGRPNHGDDDDDMGMGPGMDDGYGGGFGDGYGGGRGVVSSYATKTGRKPIGPYMPTGVVNEGAPPDEEKVAALLEDQVPPEEDAGREDLQGPGLR